MKCDAFVTHFVQVNHTNVVEEARQPDDDDDDVKKHGSTKSKVEAGRLME